MNTDYMLPDGVVLRKTADAKAVGSWRGKRRPSVLCTRCVAVRLKGGCVWLSFQWYPAGMVFILC